MTKKPRSFTLSRANVLCRVAIALFLCPSHMAFVSPVNAQSAAEWVARGDSLKADFDHEGALAAYKKAVAADTANCYALWKIAEAHVDLGEASTGALQKQRYYTAEKWARKTVRICPDEPNGYFFVAVSSGLTALFEGGKQKIRRSVDVREFALKTLAMDPEHDGAMHVLGRWNREIANLNWFLKAAAKIMYGGVPPGASNEKSVAYFEQAIEIRPEWINHHKELGITYMKMKKWTQAKAEFEKALSLPDLDDQDEAHKKEARKFLREVSKKIGANRVAH